MGGVGGWGVGVDSCILNSLWVLVEGFGWQLWAKFLEKMISQKGSTALSYLKILKNKQKMGMQK